MSIQLTIIKRTSTVNTEEVAAIGAITLESAFEWVDEMHSATGTIEVLDSKIGTLDLQSMIYLPPGGRNLIRFQTSGKTSATHWDYQFSGNMEALDQLVDRITVVQLREDLAQTS